MKKPEWLVCTNDRPAPHVVPFKELFAIKESMTALQLLWHFNSYYVDAKRKRFVINGGRNVFLPDWKNAQDVKVLYRRRHTETISFGGDGEKKHEVSYLLGLQGVLQGEQKEIMIHISPDGIEWYWKDKR